VAGGEGCVAGFEDVEKIGERMSEIIWDSEKAESAACGHPGCPVDRCEVPPTQAEEWAARMEAAVAADGDVDDVERQMSLVYEREIGDYWCFSDGSVYEAGLTFTPEEIVQNPNGIDWPEELVEFCSMALGRKGECQMAKNVFFKMGAGKTRQVGSKPVGRKP
jgi:hypothetical protein